MNASFKAELIEKYTTILYEYFHIMNTSEIVNALDSRSIVIQIGMQSITHIYKLAFFLSKQISTAVCHSQKGMYCYLEYIEQMNKTNMLHNLDNVDAVVFIYNKTLSEIYGQNTTTSMMTNILSISETDAYKGSDFMKCNKALSIASQLSSTLVWFGNEHLTTVDQMELVETHLVPLSVLFVDYSLDVLFPFLDTVQTKLAPMKKEEYHTFLKSVTKQIKRALKHQQIPTKQTINESCILLHQYKDKTVSQIGEDECWKSPMDELVRLLAG
jgi:hypothetical protein